jgi:spermidine synthase
MRWYFGFFFVSGFCSILYEIIWVRLAMAQFGVTTALVSIVLSAFMVGLGLGSWGSGYLTRKYRDRIHFPALRLYAATELLIGVSAVIVPHQLTVGRELIQRAISQQNIAQQTFGVMALSSSGFYLAAGMWIALTLIPWCACMGATFPFAMLAIKGNSPPDSGRSFSYLYVANVLGAVSGAIIPLFLIELLGFHRTLYVGASLNFLLASCAFALSLGHSAVVNVEIEARPEPRIEAMPIETTPTRKAGSQTETRLLWLLFATGLTSMGVEIVWIRMYTPSQGTVVYAFAAILASYLGTTYLGSWAYRLRRNHFSLENSSLWALLGFCVLFPFLTADPRVQLPALLRLVLGVAPFSGLVGFLTPMIVDKYSLGDPDRAGSAYAVNIVGCVVGPLISGFVLLPWIGERLALCGFALPWFGVGLLLAPGSIRKSSRSLLTASMLVFGSLALAVSTEGYEEQYKPREVRRDSTATVVATGSGFGRRLLINGVGITTLSPVTKMMVHLPLAFLQRPPVNALIICFGMGTTYRSALSWHIPSTAVELVPSVPPLFSFFHPDAPTLDAQLSRIVIDDGRSFLERSREQYDVIAIDPPPPVQAAGSSLLYSKEFYAIAKAHLRVGGILQQWLPDGDRATRASVARALQESFPYARAFGSIEGSGIHFLVSMSPIPPESALQLALRLPAGAATDLVEWGPAASPEQQFKAVLDREVSLASIVQEDPQAPALRDDRPVNEYFLVRRLRDPRFLRTIEQRVFNRKEYF